MSVAAIFRSALLGDVLSALDFAESCHRGLQRMTAAEVGLDDDTFARVATCLSSAYEGLARARQLIEDNRG